MKNLGPKILYLLNDTQINSLRKDIKALTRGEILVQGQYQTADNFTPRELIRYFLLKREGILLRLRIAHPEIHDFFRYSEYFLDFNDQPSSREEVIQVADNQLSEVNIVRDIAFLVFQILEQSISPEEFSSYNDISRETSVRLLALAENNTVAQQFLNSVNI